MGIVELSLRRLSEFLLFCPNFGVGSLIYGKWIIQFQVADRGRVSGPIDDAVE